MTSGRIGWTDVMVVWLSVRSALDAINKLLYAKLGLRG